MATGYNTEKTQISIVFFLSLNFLCQSLLVYKIILILKKLGVGWEGGKINGPGGNL